MESSNVDLTTQLVDMITAQRAFQANAQVITTANQCRRPSSTSLIDPAATERLIMDRGLYVAMTGAKQIMQAQAVNNHNIANVSTTGFAPMRWHSPANRSTVRDTQPASMRSPAMRHRFLQRRHAEHRPATSTSPSTARGSLQCAARRQGSLHPRRRFAGDADGGGHDRERISGVERIRSFGGTALDAGDHRQRWHGVRGAAGLRAVCVTQVDRIKLVNPKLSDLQKGDDGLLRLKTGGRSRPTRASRSPPGCWNRATSTPRSP